MDFTFAAALLIAARRPPLGLITGQAPASADVASIRPDSAVTRHRTAKVDGIDIFYREAGPADAPVVVLLHGFPTSSHMFRNLIPALADRYRVIAPDYPGFGQSAMPDARRVRLQLRELRRADRRFAEPARRDALRALCAWITARRSATGWRSSIPSASRALIVQNGNAYEEGLQEFWKPIKAYWADRIQEHREAMRAGLTLEATKLQYVDGVRDVVAHRSRQLGARSGAARPARQRRDPARPVQGLRHQRRALSAVPGRSSARASRRR